MWNYIVWIHWSALTIKPPTGDVNNIDHLLGSLGPWVLGICHSCGCHMSQTTNPNAKHFWTMYNPSWQWQSLMAVSPQQGRSAPWCTIKTAQEWPWCTTKSPRYWPGLQISKIPIESSPIPQHAGLKGYTTKVALPGTRGLSQRSYDHAVMGQSCFGF